MQVKGNTSVWKRIKKSRQLYLIMLPAFLATLLFSYVPMYGIVLAFQKYNPTKSMFNQHWVGFRYFEKLFGMADFYQILGILIHNLTDFLNFFSLNCDFHYS